MGGDGGKGLKLLGLYVKNIVEKPDEAKYRSINTDSNAFKGKVHDSTHITLSLDIHKTSLHISLCMYVVLSL